MTKKVFLKAETALNLLSNFMVINNFYFALFCPQSTGNHIFGTSNFEIFQGTMPPDPPRLACHFGPRFNLHRMLCFIGHLWKLLIRTLIRHKAHKDQETAPWRLHCTLTNHC